MQILEKMRESDSWEEVCERFGEYLGLDNPAPPEVVNRALKDDIFIHYLIVCRNYPDYLKKLLDDPKNKNFLNSDEELIGYAPKDEKKKLSNFDLVRRASHSLVKWAGTGFEPMNQQRYETRLDACRNCEHLVDPPKKLVYKIKLKSNSDMRICNECGCVAARKARLPTESCPVPHPFRPGFTKWNEPVQTMDN